MASIMSIASAMLSSSFSTQSDNSSYVFHTGIVFFTQSSTSTFSFKSYTRYILSSAPIFPFRSIPFLISALTICLLLFFYHNAPITHTMGLPIVSACIQKLCCHWFCKMLSAHTFPYHKVSIGFCYNKIRCICPFF